MRTCLSSPISWVREELLSLAEQPAGRDSSTSLLTGVTDPGYVGLHSEITRTPSTLLSPGVTEPQNHRMVWAGRDLKDHLVPTSLP